MWETSTTEEFRRLEDGEPMVMRSKSVASPEQHPLNVRESVVGKTDGNKDGRINPYSESSQSILPSSAGDEARS